MFSWINTKQADDFAKAVAADLMGRLPAPENGVQSAKVTPERIHSAHEAIVARAAAFARVNKLNWYKRAHLGNTFRWVLAEKGYDKTFVETWTHNLLVAVSTTAKKTV